MTGEWVTKYIYEYALADMQALGVSCHVDPLIDYEQQGPDKRVWDLYRAMRRDKKQGRTP